MDNGTPARDELFQANQRHAHQGTALLAVRSKRQSREIIVKATADGLNAATIKLAVQQL